MSEVCSMIMTNETRAAYMTNIEAYQDRRQFVKNLGILLKQTREGIVGAYLDDSEHVHVVYTNAYEEIINVNMDSYLAIIRDVTKGL